MKSSTRSLRFILMISSIILLIALEGFWLVNSYESAYVGLRRETSALLRTTVFTMRDSLFMKNAIPIKSDGHEDSIRRELTIENVGLNISEKDTLVNYLRVRDMLESLPSTYRHHDSTLSNNNGPTLKFRDGPRFIIRIGPDSLSIETLSERFHAALVNDDIDLPFHLKHFRTPISEIKTHQNRMNLPGDPERIEGPSESMTHSDTLFTEKIRVNPFHAYGSAFPNARVVLFKKILPQILFSTFLTLITVLSFLVLYRSIRKQEQLMDMKNDFMSNVTHELKTPIATVSVALEALKDFDALSNPLRTKEYLAIAQNELNRLSLMTDKILKTAAFESIGVDFKPERVDLKRIADHVLDSMKIIIDSQQIKLNYKTIGASFVTSGSEMHITNVIYNLVDNSIKYSGQGKVIDVLLEETSDRIKVIVSDDGIGIPKEYQSRIFEKFFRVPTGDVHNTKGYGLGLNYVSEVVKSHRAQIRLDSVVGEGSTFTLSFLKVK